MKRLVLLAVASLLPVEAAQVVVRAGTLINCSLSEPAFSSATAQLGDPTLCDVRPIRRPGQAFLGRGLFLVGQLSDFHDPGRIFGKGWIRLDFDRMVSPGGDTAINARVVAVRGYKVDSEGRILGKGHPKRDAVGWMFPFLWPIKAAALPARGPRPILKGEVMLTLRLLDDISVPTEEPRQTSSLSHREPATSSFPADPDMATRPTFTPSSTPPPPISDWRKLGSQPVDTGWRKFGSNRPPIQ